MVHGGGHHYGGGGEEGGGHHGGGHHSGSSSGWGGSNQNTSQFGNTFGNSNQTVVVNNVATGYGGYQNSGFGFYNTNQRDEECERCCRNACCLGCCLGMSGAVVQRNYCPRAFFCTCLSMLVFAILMMASNLNESWTLNPGETRQVHVGVFNQDLHMNSNIPNGVAIYAILGKCPALTGPKVSLNDTTEIELEQGDYQYDYFYLNKGSYIDVTILQHSGASNIIILRGAIPNDSTEADTKIYKGAILERYAAKGQTIHVQYTAPNSDTYVVVYDNASNSHGRLTITYHVDLTSFDLTGQKSAACEKTTECTLNRRDRHSCILIQADEVVTVHIFATRLWGMIALLVTLPLSIGCFCWSQVKGYENPPALNPTVIPSAPPYQMAQTEEPIYVVPAEYVIPIATALDNKNS